MTIKSNMTKPERKKRVRVNRDIPAVVIDTLEDVADLVRDLLPDIAPETIIKDIKNVIINVEEDVKEAVIEVVENVEELAVEMVEEVAEEVVHFVDNVHLIEPEPLAEVSSMPPPTDEEYNDDNCPVSPCLVSKKRTKKVVEPKPLRNNAGDYLNPRTNRYVKQGTSAYKLLVKEGVFLECV
jgi:hypothetical protein